jgi:gluconolactonase
VAATPIELESRDPKLVELVGDRPAMETIASGFRFTEGPVWHEAGRFLLFTDIAGDRIYRWDEMQGLAIFREPSRMANGLAYDNDGRLVACEHASSRLTRTEHDGSVSTLAARYDAKELNSPNDVIVACDGTIYFTDPAYGREEFWGVPRQEQLGFRGLFAVDPQTDSLRLLADDFIAPNGLCLSADEKLLYVNDSERGHIRRFCLRPNGQISGGEEWARLEEAGEGSPDGMKLDEAGNVFCCGPGGIHVFSADAECLGLIRMPEFAANICFGGNDRRDLYITATTTVYRLRLNAAGVVYDRARCARQL